MASSPQAARGFREPFGPPQLATFGDFLGQTTGFSSLCAGVPE